MAVSSWCRPEQVVVSVEHAYPAVPAALGGLGLPEKLLQSHHGWDPGAARVGRILAAEHATSLEVAERQHRRGPAVVRAAVAVHVDRAAELGCIEENE